VSTSEGPWDPSAPDILRGIEGDLAEMLGLAKGILADGVVTESEAVLLREWMDAHPGVVGGWPGSVLSRRLRQIFDDGVATSEECEDLALLLEELLGGKIGIMRGGATALPLDDPRPAVEVPGRVFVLTGRFAFGPKQACEEAIQQAGGSCVEAISKDTHYIVIGTFGAKNWIHSNWGREIATAVEYRRHYGQPFIIAEDHWAASI